MLGLDFDRRGDRADESLELMRALWSGQQRFSGRRWSLDDATFGPTPQPPPALWVGGNSSAAQDRAVRHGDIWHPFMPDPGDVAAFRDRSDLPVRPRMLLSFDPDRAGDVAFAGTPEQVADHLEELADAGADGFVVSLDPPPHQDSDGLDVFVEHVVAALQERAAAP